MVGLTHGASASGLTWSRLAGRGGTNHPQPPPPRPRDGPLSLGHAPPLALYAPGQLVPCHLGSNRHCRKNDEYFFLMTHHAPCSEISVFYCRTETVSNHFLHLILIVLKN